MPISEEDDGSFPGRITGKLILTYEDAAGNSYEESTEFESEIKEAKIQSLKIEDDQEETNSWWYSVIAVIAPSSTTILGCSFKTPPAIAATALQRPPRYK